MDQKKEQLRQKLEELRSKVLGYDKSILNQLNERMTVCKDIGATKVLLQGASTADVYKPTQEKLVFQRIVRMNNEIGGDLTDTAACAVWREVMSASIALQQPTTVAYVGPPGSFCQQACKSRFGASVDYRPNECIRDVFDAVRDGRTTYGVVPIENSNIGRYSTTMDLLVQFDTSVVIFAEIHIPVRYCVYANTEQTDATSQVLYCEPYALTLCSSYVKQTLPDAKVVTCLTSSSAAKACNETPGSMCITNTEMGEVYGLALVTSTADNSYHEAGAVPSVSRYFVLGRDLDAKSGSDKTFVIFSLKDRAGSLVEALSVFKHCGINIDKIESRPYRNTNNNHENHFDYIFFVDLDGHADDESIQRAVYFLQQNCTMVRVLGSCPRPLNIRTERRGSVASATLAKL